MAFDPKEHMMSIKGKSYLPVSARLVWFREEHPDWGINTTPIEINLEKQYAIYQASIFNAEGKLMATATKMENVKGFPDYLEKSETGAVGRALAFCGYGTQFAPELEEGERLADGPIERRSTPTAAFPQENVRRGPGPGMQGQRPTPTPAGRGTGGDFPK